MSTIEENKTYICPREKSRYLLIMKLQTSKFSMDLVLANLVRISGTNY